MSHIPPPWQRPADPPATAEVPRAPDGRFVPGASGNPNGRPAGLIDRRHRVAKAFDAEFDAIGAALVARAKGGDVGAMALYLSRVEPPLRPRGDRTPFALDTTQPLAAQAAQVIQALAAGDLSGEAAQTVLACLSTYTKLVEADTLDARIKRLEQHAAATGNHQGIAYTDDLK